MYSFRCNESDLARILSINRDKSPAQKLNRKRGEFRLVFVPWSEKDPAVAGNGAENYFFGCISCYSETFRQYIRLFRTTELDFNTSRANSCWRPPEGLCCGSGARSPSLSIAKLLVHRSSSFVFARKCVTLLFFSLYSSDGFCYGDRAMSTVLQS